MLEMVLHLIHMRPRICANVLPFDLWGARSTPYVSSWAKHESILIYKFECGDGSKRDCGLCAEGKQAEKVEEGEAAAERKCNH